MFSKWKKMDEDVDSFKNLVRRFMSFHVYSKHIVFAHMVYYFAKPKPKNAWHCSAIFNLAQQ